MQKNSVIFWSFQFWIFIRQIFLPHFFQNQDRYYVKHILQLLWGLKTGSEWFLKKKHWSKKQFGFPLPLLTHLPRLAKDLNITEFFLQPSLNIFC